MNVHTLVSPANVSVLLNIAKETPKGIFIEVGVYKGGTAYYLNELAKERNNALWLFDTFEGMPESTDGVDFHPVGHFSDCSYQEVKKLVSGARIFKGFFPDTLPMERDIPPVAFVHVDCDQYDSIKECILKLIPLLVVGGVMYFDDYGCLDGATKAIDAYCPDRVIMKNGKAMYTKGRMN